jgi:branched-chain amino acid transport system permease protein
MAEGEGLTQHLRRASPPLFLIVALVLIAGITLLTTEVIARVVTTMLVMLVVVVGLYTFVGNSGVFSFGHTSFMAIGAYSGALLTIPPSLKHVLLPHLPGFLAQVELPTAVAVLLAGAAGAVVAAVAAVPLMRLSGIAASIGTLALLVVVYVAISNADSVTGGYSAIIGVPIDTSIFVALGAAALTIAAAYAFERSPTGLRLRASREDEYAAQAIGVHIARERAVAFILSAFIVGVGGALYGHLLGSFNPDAFYIRITVLSVAMLVVGGVNSLSGAVAGTVVISGLTEVLRRLEEGAGIGAVHVGIPHGFAEIVLALLMLVILITRPAGITGGRNLEWGWWARIRRQPHGRQVGGRATVEREVPPAEESVAPR